MLALVAEPEHMAEYVCWTTQNTTLDSQIITAWFSVTAPTNLPTPASLPHGKNLPSPTALYLSIVYSLSTNAFVTTHTHCSIDVGVVMDVLALDVCCFECRPVDVPVLPV